MAGWFWLWADGLWHLSRRLTAARLPCGASGTKALLRIPGTALWSFRVLPPPEEWCHGCLYAAALAERGQTAAGVT